MALTIEQTQKTAAKRKVKAATPAKTVSKRASAVNSKAKAKKAKASVRKTVKPWSQASTTTINAAGLQKWMDVVIDRVFEQPLPAFIDKSDVKKRSEALVDLVEKGVEIGQERVQQIRQKNPVLNELIDVAQKQLKKAQGYINKK